MRVRRARFDARLRQADVADRAGVSQATICRIEHGRGAGVPLATWARVAGAIGLDLAAALDAADLRHRASPERRICDLIASEAARGGWTAEVSIDVGRTEVVLHRPVRNECVVAHVWRDVADVDAAIADLEVRARTRHAELGPAWTIRSLVVVSVSKQDRRRWTERQALIDSTFPELGARWLLALRSPTGRLPGRDGLLWVDRDFGRIRPTIIEIDRRRRGPRRRRRPGA